LYGDFLADDEQAFQAFADSLQAENTSSPRNKPTSSPDAISDQHSQTPVSIGSRSRNVGSQSTPATPSTATQPCHTVNSPTQLPKRPKLLALCVNSGGIYKTLAELDMTDVNSDAEAFLLMKKAYLLNRGLRSRLKLLLKPVTVEFVQVRPLSFSSPFLLLSFAKMTPDTFKSSRSGTSATGTSPSASAQAVCRPRTEAIMNTFRVRCGRSRRCHQRRLFTISSTVKGI